MESLSSVERHPGCGPQDVRAGLEFCTTPLQKRQTLGGSVRERDVGVWTPQTPAQLLKLSTRAGGLAGSLCVPGGGGAPEHPRSLQQLGRQPLGVSSSLSPPGVTTKRSADTAKGPLGWGWGTKFVLD